MRYLLALALAGCFVGSGGPSQQDQSASVWGPYDPEPGHPTADERAAFIAEIGPYAQEAEAASGPPAAALTAMACNESGFGWTRIALYANNLFGWKWYSAATAGGRGAYTLANQPASDPGNQYVEFSDRQDSVSFVAGKLATLSRYQPVTAQYQSDVANGVDVKTAVDRWIYGLAAAGYNPYASYPATTIQFMTTYDLYALSPPAAHVWISIDSPAAGATVSGDVTLTASTGGGTVTSVKLSTRAHGATTDWYLVGEVTGPPFTHTWATAGWVSDGDYDVRAEAWNGSTLLATGVETLSVSNGM